MINKLYVMTTATPRAELHLSTYFPVLKLLRAHEAYEVIPLVNLDKPSMSTDEEFEHAKNQFISQNVHYYENTVNPCFSLAGRTLCNQCAKMVSGDDNNLFFWFEDDWILRDEGFADMVAQLFNSKYSCLITTVHDHITGNPSVFRQEFFNIMLAEYSNNDKNVDPELVIFESQRKLDSVDEWRLPPKNVLQTAKPIFEDMGRPWRAKHNIEKGNKYQAETMDRTWFKKS